MLNNNAFVDNGTEPLSSEEFKEHIVSEYAAKVDGVGIDACIGAAVDEVWPAPDYRENQREAVVDILHDLYVNDNDVVTLSAPTGAGKSLILHGVMATLHNEFEKDAFFSTPLNALIDQVDSDEFIQDDVVTLKGKNNYPKTVARPSIRPCASVSRTSSANTRNSTTRTVAVLIMAVKRWLRTIRTW